MISQEEMTSALIKELCSGRMLMETKQQFREIDAATEAKALLDRKTPAALGKAVAVVPQHEYFLLRNKYGAECWHDPQFVRDFQRLEPSMAVHKI